MMKNRTLEDYFYINYFERFYVINKIIIFLNIFGLLYLSKYLGFTLSTFINIDTLMNKMNSIAYIRYSMDAESFPLICRIINSLVYSACAYDGFFLVKRRSITLLFNIIIIAIQTVITNTKATLVFGIAFFLSGIIIGYIYYSKKLKLNEIVSAASYMTLSILFFTVINYLRHMGSNDIIIELQKIIVAYFIGPYSAFSIWFSNKETNKLGLGINTFSSIFRLLGASHHAHGEFVYINGISTNVYTIYKHLISDYSLFGTLLISYFFGMIVRLVEEKLSINDYRYIGIAISILSTILITFFSSIFRYSINVIACFLITLFCIPIRIKYKDFKL